MDSALRLQKTPRDQLLFGAYALIRIKDKTAPEDRIDVPAIEDSTRVTFGRGIGVQASSTLRSSTDRALQLYQSVQAL